ncbi:MAG: DUF2059 domain-containing protein [Acidobacteriota bacterium]|nr:DUF2059 domain-containing protein [Acidobacteriota bacterium]
MRKINRNFRPLPFVVALAIASSVFAQNATAPESAKEVKIGRLLALTNAEAMVNRVFDQIKTMTSQMPPGATPEQRATTEILQAGIIDLVKARMSWDKMRPRYVQVYGETFSDEEIDGMLAFYQSSAGRAVLEKMPMLMPKMMALAQAQMGDILPDIQRLTKEAQPGSPAPQPAAKSAVPATGTAAEVLQVEDAFRLAKLGNDTAALGRILADDYIGMNQYGARRDKSEVIDLFSAFKLSVLTPAQAKVRLSGDIAVVDGSQTERNPAGEEHLLFMRVYVKRDGRWQLLSSAQVIPSN